MILIRRPGRTLNTVYGWSLAVLGTLPPSDLANAIGKIAERVASGVARGKIYATVLDNSATYATGNIACTRANAAGDSPSPTDTTAAERMRAVRLIMRSKSPRSIFQMATDVAR